MMKRFQTWFQIQRAALYGGVRLQQHGPQQGGALHNLKPVRPVFDSARFQSLNFKYEATATKFAFSINGTAPASQDK
jgi:hypothetical protein